MCFFCSFSVRHARASAKKYCSQEHHNEILYARWDRRIQLLEWKIVQVLRNKEDLGSGRNPQETVCAYVIFNNEESAVRAQQDYHGSEHSWNRHFQPKHLRFLEEFPLIIKEGPNPSDILWENLETSAVELHRRRCTTCSGTFVVLLISFAVVVTTLYYAAIFANNVARPMTCNAGVPYHYLSSVNNFTSNESSFDRLDRVLPTSTEGEMLYLRPPVSERAEKDALCNVGNVQTGTMRWLTLDLSSVSNKFKLAPITYDTAVCDSQNSCPGVGTSLSNAPTVYCPCIDSSHSAESCALNCPGSSGCAPKISGRDVADCFCYQTIKLSLNGTSTGITGDVSSLLQQEPMCTQYALLYVTGRQLVNSVAYLVTFTNVIIESVVKTIVPYEHSHSVSELSSAISMKMYLALTLNTVLSPVLAKVRLFDEQANTTATAQTQVTPLPLSGDDKYIGFPLHWYSTVGTTLVSAMILDIFVPHIIPILRMCVTKQIVRRRARAAHQSFVTQRELNDVFEGPSFDMATRLGYVLNTCACTLTFSSGLPILVPMAMASFFVSYWVDKYLILRYYKRPPQIKSTTIVQAFSTLPLVVLMHLFISMLTFGDSTVFVSTKMYNYDTTVPEETLFLGHETLLLLVNSVDRQHILPTLIFFSITLVCIVLHLFPASPLIQLINFLRVLLGRRTRRVSANNPPFTSMYVKPILKRHWKKMENWVGRMANCCKYIVLSSMVDGDADNKTKAMLSKAEKMNGWVIKEENVTGGTFKMKEWKRDGYDNQGIKHDAGTLKRTWECIRDDGLYSYKIDQNPQYADAMRTMYASKKVR